LTSSAHISPSSLALLSFSVSKLGLHFLSCCESPSVLLLSYISLTFVNAGLFVFILKCRVLIWIELKCSVLVLQKRCRLVIFGRRSNVFVDSRSFPLSLTNIGIMATPVVSSFIKHCCAITLIVFAHPLSTKLFYEAKKVVLGFLDHF